MVRSDPGAARMKGGRRHIGLLDHMGGGNLGDDSTQTAVILAIRRRWPGAELYGFSMNPADTTARHGIPSYPIRQGLWQSPGQGAQDAHSPVVAESPVGPLRLVVRAKRGVAELRFLVRSYRTLRRIDLLLISGGGQLLDSWGGPWEFPYTLFKWVLLARLAGASCYFINVGAGPIQHRLSRLFILAALVLAQYVSFRDEDSKSLMRRLGYRGVADVFPDCVYGLDLQPSEHEAAQPIVGVSPMAYCDPRRYWLKDQARYEAFMAKLAATTATLTGRYCVTFFSTDIAFDAQTLDEARQALQCMAATVQENIVDGIDIHDADTLIRRLAGLDFVITCRFHGAIFAHLMNIPFIALAHHPKVSTLMATLGLSTYCLDIDTFDSALLLSRFEQLHAEREEIRARMEEQVLQFRRALDSQFDRLFPACAA